MGDASFYTTGGTVQAGRGLYITRKADEELLELCRAGTFAFVLTARQMGKSSLLMNTQQRLRQEGARCAYVDLTKLGTQATAEQWYLGFVVVTAALLELDTPVERWWEEHRHLGLTQRLVLFFEDVVLRELPGRVVVFVDEIDTTLSLDFTDDFYAAVRYLYNERAQRTELGRLSFVMVGVATPGDLMKDAKRTPFNLGQRVDLTDFTEEEAKPLAAGLGLEGDEGTRVLSWVLKWTGGHPYLTQRLCHVLVEHGKQGHAYMEEEVDAVVTRTVMGDRAGEEQNLQFVRDMLTRRAPDQDGVLKTYRQVWFGKRVEDEERSLVKAHLKLSGIVKREGSLLGVRNRIYEEVFDAQWVKRNLPVDRRRLMRLVATLGTIIALQSALVAGFAIQWFKAAEATAEARRERNRAEQQAARAEHERQAADNAKKYAEENERHLEEMHVAHTMCGNWRVVCDSWY